MTDEEFDAEWVRLEDERETARLAWYEVRRDEAHPQRADRKERFDSAQIALVEFRKNWRLIGIAVGARPAENSPGITVTEART